MCSTGFSILIRDGEEPADFQRAEDFDGRRVGLKFPDLSLAVAASR